MCDGGERYAHSYYDDWWLQANGLGTGAYLPRIEAFFERGEPQEWGVAEARR
jgi:cysteine synthase A